LLWRTRTDASVGFRWRDYEELRDRRDLVEDVIAETTRFVSSNGHPLSAALVSDNYFDMLRPRLALGRGLGAFDAQSSDVRVVLAYKAWSRLLGRARSALGSRIDINGRGLLVVGIVGPEFTGLDDMPRDLWMPLAAYAAAAIPDLTNPKQPRNVELVVRLRVGVTPQQTQSALTPFVAGAVPTKDAADVAHAELVPRATPNPLSLELLAVLSPVFAAFGLVLVTACANVSNVLLARAVARQREIAVRLSLGAGRGRVIRQLLTEGLMIAALAGLAGLLLAAWTLRAGRVALFRTLPAPLAALLRVAPLGFDHRVFLFALAVAAATTLVFALLPALHASRLSLMDALGGARSGTRGGSTLRSGLVIAQVAVSLVLVVAALTLTRNGAALNAIDLGYRADGVMSINVRGDDTALARRLATILATDPRVAEVAVTDGNPLFVRSRAVAVSIDQASSATPVRYTFVSPEYFSILRIRVVRGRGFRQDEARSSAPVAVISSATAAAFWPGQDPIGRTITLQRPEGRPVDDLPGYPLATVVGVVPDVVSGMIFDGRDANHMYLPTTAEDAHARAVLVRARSDRDLGPEALEAIFRQVAPDPQMFEALPLEEMRAVQMYPLRAASGIGSFLALLALGLSLSGLYGVLSYTVAQRTREIGIRLALGATAGAIVALVMRQSARLAAVGALVGLTVAFAAMKGLSAAVQLREVSALDAAAFGGGLATVMAATALAAFYPSRRATRVDPAETLRADG
jgi:predicted permease